jgi:hypothetical protein
MYGCLFENKIIIIIIIIDIRLIIDWLTPRGKYVLTQ